LVPDSTDAVHSTPNVTSIPNEGVPDSTDAVQSTPNITSIPEPVPDNTGAVQLAPHIPDERAVKPERE